MWIELAMPSLRTCSVSSSANLLVSHSRARTSIALWFSCSIKFDILLLWGRLRPYHILASVIFSVCCVYYCLVVLNVVPLLTVVWWIHAYQRSECCVCISAFARSLFLPIDWMKKRWGTSLGWILSSLAVLQLLLDAMYEMTSHTHIHTHGWQVLIQKYKRLQRYRLFAYFTQVSQMRLYTKASKKSIRSSSRQRPSASAVLPTCFSPYPPLLLVLFRHSLFWLIFVTARRGSITLLTS